MEEGVYKTKRMALRVTLSDAYGNLLTLLLLCIHVSIWRRNATMFVEKKKNYYTLIKIVLVQ